MSSFDLAIDTVLLNEGGYVDDPNDKGGATNFGLSQRTYPNLDIKNLTKEQAIGIYKKDFWKYDGVLDQLVATKIFDASVNLGHVAIVLLQKIVLKATPPDGIFGEVTEDAVNRAEAGALLTQYRLALAQHYQSIVTRNPQDAKFLTGWLRRANQ